MNLKSIYANASITRVSYGFDKEYSIRAFEYWKKILVGENVLIVEGEKTRFGVGNDLLCNIQNINRAIAPKHDAFAKCDEIINFIENSEIKYDRILVALGPAAKYLVFELYNKGFKAIDIGNLDIEYEWFLRGAAEKRIAIPGKYTSEVKGGREVGDIPDKAAFKQYQSEICASFL